MSIPFSSGATETDNPNSRFGQHSPQNLSEHRRLSTPRTDEYRRLSNPWTDGFRGRFSQHSGNFSEYSFKSNDSDGRKSSFVSLELDTDVLEGSDYEDPGVDDDLQPLMPHNMPLEAVIGSNGHVMGPFSFVESNSFQLASGAIILLNAILIFIELLDRDQSDDLLVLDQLFLGFYCVELILRLLHFERRFFAWNASHDLAWNLLDVLLVFTGVVDQWVLPLLLEAHTTKSRTWVGMFRMLRLLRIVRLMRVLVHADFSWVESNWFQVLAGCVIALSACIMGIETDVKSPMWWWVEEILLVFFVFELSVRWRHRGLRFFTDPDDSHWNILDFVVVFTGVMDMWVLQLWSKMTSKKEVRPLFNLAMGILRAMQSMLWVLVLTMGALYCFAILTTRMIKSLIVDEHMDIPEETSVLFQSVPDSMFTLFAIMNGQYWRKVDPLLDMVPWTKPIFVTFTILGSWALLSIMTGVVSDHMTAVRESQEQRDGEQQEEQRQRMRQTLTEIFAAADRDGRGTLARAEYLEVLQSPYHIRKLQRVVNVPVGDIRRMFDWLDIDGIGEIDFQDFVDSFDKLKEQVQGRSLLKVDSVMKLAAARLDRRLCTLNFRVEHLNASMEESHVALRESLQEAFGVATGSAEERGLQRAENEEKTTEKPGGILKKSKTQTLSLAGSVSSQG